MYMAFVGSYYVQCPVRACDQCRPVRNITPALYAAGAGRVNEGFHPFERYKTCIRLGNRHFYRPEDTDRMKIHDDVYPYAWNHAFSIADDRV